jgi:hypothetical protein
MHKPQAVEFRNITEIRSAHRSLLQRNEEEGATPEMRTAIAEFMSACRNAGARIGDNDERWLCQDYLDYWATTLYSWSDRVPDTRLDPYNEDLAPELQEEHCPYVGLRAFEASDADVFFGRGQESEQLAQMVEERRLAIVIGPSGAGKSSLLRAGLVPRLGARASARGSRWHEPIYLSPGGDPARSMAMAQTALSTATGTTLVMVDQLEELYTLCLESRKAQSFVDWMVAQAKKKAPKVYIVAALSSDFQQQLCMALQAKRNVDRITSRAHPQARDTGYSDACETHLYKIRTLEPSRLREVILLPARARNLQFEDKVVDQLVKDLATEPMPLPLLQFLLIQLWRRRKGNRIKYSHYLDLIGDQAGEDVGAWGALASCADRLYTNLDSVAEKITLKNIMLRLIQLNEIGAVTLQRVDRHKLMELAHDPMLGWVVDRIRKDYDISRAGGQGAAPTYTVAHPQYMDQKELSELRENLASEEAIDNVLKKLCSLGLIRCFHEKENQASTQIELAHEVLVKYWPRLRRWTQNPRVRDELELERDLKRAASTWEARGRNSGFLWTDARLLKSLAKPGSTWRATPDELKFVARSKRKHRSQVGLKLVAAILFVAGVTATIAYQFMGLREIKAPFDERNWVLNIRYHALEEVKSSLSEDMLSTLREHGQDTPASAQGTPRKRHEAVAALERFRAVAGKSSDPADVLMTRRRLYGAENKWVWTGFTTDFRFPGTDNRMYLSFNGETHEKSPSWIPIEFSQFQFARPGDKANKVLSRYTIDFASDCGSSEDSKLKKYCGDIMHPILGVPIARMILKQTN